jgi:catechol 2,3-dioxygenase-like lactoylglutathione lyase family enzyme
MQPGPDSHLRIARPSRDLARAERFWVNGLNLEVLFRLDATDDDEDHSLVMLGWPQAPWHLELVEDVDGETPPAPTEEDLLVLYVGGPIDDELIDRLVEAGGERVPSRNPYWDKWGVTIRDPDGYRLVLSHRSWP